MINKLQEKANNIRKEVVEMLFKSGSGHCGGSLSAVEILTVLYFDKLKIDIKRPDWEDRDRFIASKGHCAPAIYAVLAMKGFFPKKELDNLRKLGSMLQGHPDMRKTPGVDFSTGSLGMGLSVGIGKALAAKHKNKSYYTFILMGDGELQEGQVWEALMAASKYNLCNCITIIDNNGVQLDGSNNDIMPIGDIRQKFESFGWNTITIDGHDLKQISDAVDEAKSCRNKPSAIIAKTVKGKGISFMEGKYEWHGKPIGRSEYLKAKKELEK